MKDGMCKKCGKRPRYVHKGRAFGLCAPCALDALQEFLFPDLGLFGGDVAVEVVDEKPDRDAEQRDEAEQGKSPLPKAYTSDNATSDKTGG